MARGQAIYIGARASARAGPLLNLSIYIYMYIYIHTRVRAGAIASVMH